MSDGAPQPARDASEALGTAKVGKLLAQYALPAIVSTSVTSLYNIVDRIFIGHGVGPMAISGLALTLPMMNLAAAFGALVGVGAAALVSIRLGERRREEAHAILSNAVFLNLVLGFSYSVLCLMFLDRILFAMGASRETLPYARQFMRIILLGNVCTHLYLGLNNVMRASGYPRKAMLITLTTVGVNVALAPLFIFVFRWGIRGAAFATVCAQTAGMSLLAVHFARKDSTVRFCKTYLRPRFGIIRGIVAVGMSNFSILFFASFIAVSYNVRLARYGGDYAIGAFGIVNSLVNLIVMLAVGVNMGMQPIAGYNFGARRFDRVVRVFRLAVAASTCITTTGFLLGEVFPGLVAGAFTTNGELIRQSVFGMRFTFALFPIVGFQMVTSGLFQAIGKAQISILLSLSRQALILIPCLVLLPGYFGLAGVWVSGPVSDFSASLVALLILKTQFRRKLRAA